MKKTPEELLRQIHKEDEEKHKGKLKIFFSYIAGAGKTYAMLLAAGHAKSMGKDVVIGYLEPHERPETSVLADGLERLPLRHVLHHDIELKEFDLDAALERKSDLILVDEFAHTNAPGSRHKKRYQDIKELLAAGINVYTTINVQHIESLNDKVASMSHVIVQERIPDYVFDEADEVEFVDIEPKDLIERLQAGKVYRANQASRALDHFFTLDNLVSLREMALRRSADRILQRAISSGPRKAEDITGEHILVCLSSSPTNAKVIRNAARMAHAFQGKFTALYVEPTNYQEQDEKCLKVLRDNMALAQQFGATVDAVICDNIGQAICEYARLSHVSRVVLGRSPSKKTFFSKPTLVEEVTQGAPELDIYIIPVKVTQHYIKKKKKQTVQGLDILVSLVWLIGATAVGYLFKLLDMNEANMMMIYIIAVIGIALTTKDKIYSLVSSLVSVYMFNFFFTEPYYTFQAYNPHYPVTFAVMAVVALLLSQLTSSITRNSRKNAKDAYRMQILLETNKLLQVENNQESIIDVGCRQLKKLLNKDIVYFPVENENLKEPILYLFDEKNKFTLSSHEKTVASWVLKNKKQAGASTSTLPESMCRYLAIYNNDIVFGIIGIHLENDTLDAFDNNILLSILGEMGLALKNDYNTKEKMKTEISLKNEQLRSHLLRSISHDLRTPLTSISGNAALLLDKQMNINQEKSQILLNHIYDDSLWLMSLVENLLSMTRIEDGSIHLHKISELVDDLLEEAMKHIIRYAKNHTVKLQIDDEFMLVRVDAKLFIQVIINIVDNALKYTQDDSTIIIHAYKKENNVIIDIKDNGEGIPDDQKKHIFEMFYTGRKVVSDSRRSLGLGLFLCHSIMKVHDGSITVLDNTPKGALFRIQIANQEVDLYGE